MRGSNSQHPWFSRSTTLILSSLFLLFLVLPETRARSVLNPVAGGETTVSVDKKDGDVVAGVEEVQKDEVDSVLSERIKTGVRDVPPDGIVPEEKVQEVQEQPAQKVGKIGGAGIRRFDAGGPEGDVAEGSKVNLQRTHIDSEPHVQVSEVKVNVLNDQEDGLKEAVENDKEERDEVKRGRVDIGGEVLDSIKTSDEVGVENIQQDAEAAGPISADDVRSSFPEGQQQPESGDSGDITQSQSRNVISINSDGTGKFESANQETETANQETETPKQLRENPESSSPKELPKSEANYTMIESIKQQAMLLQQQIRDKTLFQSVKEPTLVMPDVPLLTETDILEALKSVSSTKKHHDVSIEPFSHHSLSNKQAEIIQCSAAIIAQQQRQTFLGSMFECVSNLSVLNCMRVFIYPILAETVPQLFMQNILSLPIEINVSDSLPNRNKTKTARSGTFLIYPMLSTEELFIGMLKDVLDTHRSFESVPSYIDPMNETFIKLLSPGQMKILQMAEKILPVTMRREYSDRMYSCVMRFEYFSCLRHFAWPMMKKYYSALPDFPEYEVLYPVPTFTEYPILPFPLEPGQFPEVVEADLQHRPRPDALILRILREGAKPGRLQAPYYMPLNSSSANASETADKSKLTSQYLLPLEQMIKTLPFPQKIPQAPTIPIAVPIPQHQLDSLYAAKQILPPQLRAEFASQSLKCIREINFYACMKYYTWPIVRQVQPTLPQFPNLTDLFQLPDFSQFFQLPDFSGFFQLPGFPVFGPPTFPTIPFFPWPSFPEIPVIPTTPNITTVPEIPPRPNITIPEIPQRPNITIPEVPQRPDITIPEIPQRPDITIPEIPQRPNITVPEIPPRPNITGIPEFPVPPTITIPEVASRPNITTIQFPSPQNVTIPLLPPMNIPIEPADTPSLIIRDVLRIQTAPGTVDVEESRNSPVGSEPIESNFEEKPERSAEQTVSDAQEVPKTPQIHISSRKNEMASNVPMISITGNEFVPVPSEKPETVIFTILRLYQISDPSLMNTLAISFLNSSTPEYANFLTLHQENTILLARSMLPESIRSSFSEQMISCVRDKDFLTCSREVMFPTLSSYFPNLPSFPIFGSPESPPKFLQPNSSELLPDSQPISETKVKTDKHGEATVTITDTRFIPIFSEHPEGVIMKILGAVQNSTPNLTPGYLKTREIASQPEFEGTFSEKQIMIVELAESLLPEQLRESFIKRMLECSRDEEFLECTRDIAFPGIAQYYPDLPSFPNFGNLMGASSGNPQDPNPPVSIQLLQEEFNRPDIDADSAYLHQVENHLQNEIENILTRAVSVFERSKFQADVQADVPLPISHGLLSKQQRNILRLSDSILPDSIRPAYHAKMTECIQSNSFVSCMQNVGLPILRLNPLLLNTALRPTPDYSSQAPGYIPASPINIPSMDFNYDNPGYIQQAAPVHSGGAAPDITSSVGRELSAPEIPAYAGQPFAPFVDISQERVDPEKQQGDVKPESENLKVEHSRRKRSPTDLLDSYPKHDPDEAKGSVRKNLSKSTALNMTESELLQLLLHVKNSKSDQRRDSPYPPKEYFVDSLDPEARKTLTKDQVEILKLVEDLNPGNARGIMSQIWQCIRSLSVIRCAGVFILPMITSNLPSFGLFGGRSEVSSEVQEFFGMPPNDFEKELMLKKQQFEDVLLSWYKTLMEEKFENNIGFLKVKGHGNGELGISLAGFREGRAKVIKDNKNLPSILTIISDILEDFLEPKPNSNKNKKDPKRGKSVESGGANHQSLGDVGEDGKMERSMKDDWILAALLDKLRTNDSDTKNDNYRQYFRMEDVYKAFELLFGSRLTSEIKSRFKSISEDDIRSFINRNIGGGIPFDNEMKLFPLEVQEELMEEKLKLVPLLMPQSYYNHDDEKRKVSDIKKELSKEQFSRNELPKDQEKLKNGFKEGASNHKKKHRSELSIQLPRLNDAVISKKMSSSIINKARGLKTKMMQMMPGIGMLISFVLQMALSHARTAASVAGLMSNMALGMGMFSMVRDAVFGQPNNPKIKYVYDTETADPGVTWPKNPSYWK